MAEAAYCSECNGYVWVAPTGGCKNGHQRSCLRDVHQAAELPTPIGVPPARPPQAPAPAAGVSAGVPVAAAAPFAPSAPAPPAAHPSPQTPPQAPPTSPDSGFVSQGDPLSAPVTDPYGYYMPPAQPVNAANTNNLGVRIAAYIIDFIIVMSIQTLVGGAIGIMAGFSAAMSGSDPAAVGEGLGFNLGLYFVGFLITVGYFTILEATLGFTPGKRIFGLRVVNGNADTITWGQSLGRNLMRFIDLLFWGIVGLVSVSTSELHQRLGDKVAKTYVVR